MGSELAAQVDARGVQALAQRRSRQGTWALALGGFGTLFGTFWSLWGLVIVVLGDSKLAGALLSLLGGLGPALAAALTFWWGVTRQQNAEGLRQLSILGRDGALLSQTRLSSWTLRDTAQSQALLMSAVSLRVAAPIWQDPVGEPAASPIDFTAFHARRRSLGRRAALLLAATVPAFGFGSFWFVIGLAAIMGGDPLIGVLLLLAGCAVPLSIAGLAAWRGFANFRHHKQLGRLCVALADTPVSVAELAAAMAVSPSDARRTALDALEHGIVAAPALASISGLTLATGQLGALPPVQTGPSRSGVVIANSWQLEGEIGAGGMANVYRARRLSDGARVAIKIVRSAGPGADDLSARVERELKACQLEHPHLVKLHDHGRTADGSAYLVMDLLSGETLESRLQRSATVSWTEALEVAEQIGSALTVAHASGLLHRDIKPSNIFLETVGGKQRAVLLDFGLAKPLWESQSSPRVTRSGASVGTPLYMSPEQARGEELDARSDLFGLCTVIYEMVCGVPPFFDKTIASVYARLLNEAAPRLESAVPVPSGLAEVLERGLSADRERRQSDIPELLAQLRALGEPQEATALVG